FTGLSVSGKAGSLAFDFASPNLTSIRSSLINLSAGAAASMAATTATSFSAQVGARLPDLFVQVSDQFGNPIAGVTVTFSGSPGSNVGTASVLTNTQGLAGVQWTLPKVAGTYSVTASASGLSGSPITFAATANPTAASHIEIVSGNGFTDTVGKATTPLVVRVRDDYGN